LRIIRDIEDAKSTLLGRSPLEQYRVSPGIERKIKEIFGEVLTPEQVVGRIIADVRTRGDAALLDYEEKFDGARLGQLEVTDEEMAEACTRLSPKLISSLNLAADRIRSFHLFCKDRMSLGFAKEGMGQFVRPLARVGIYVPGGTASYPSTVLMTAIPAHVAGVSELILTTPPTREGLVPEATLAAASIAHVSRIFKIGGAQAIAAMAFGTESVPKVDKICGPGNIFVTLAKKMLYGIVGIDGLYGPTETVIIADETADPALCAADLLAQAEHDVGASAILLTTSEGLANRVSLEVERQLANLDRRDIAAQALERRGGIVIVTDMEGAIELANFYAPEHLSLMVRNGWQVKEGISNAGGIFIGENSPEVLADYVAGPSHVMPTGGSARFSSVLGVSDFLKTSSLMALDDKILRELGDAAVVIAQAEGLSAHAEAIEMRLRKLNAK
jgi:histidinol dehydrogenase